jgi:hypothetical protein
MPAYRALIEGRNFLLTLNGKTRRHGFYQTVFVQASDPAEAEASALRAVKDDAELKDLAQNNADDPPMLYVDALYELEGSGPLPQAEGRTHYIEKSWWQFWK